MGRILAGAWWLVAIILYAVYTSNLIAFLAVDITSKPFNSLRELVEQGEYQYGVEDGIIQMMLFKVGCETVVDDIIYETVQCRLWGNS